MNEIVRVNYDSERPTVLGRDLHEALEIATPYSKWFNRMCEYGFTENVDFVTVDKNVLRADGAEMPQTQHDHQLTIDMAKEICMIQRTEIGKKCREYFLELERKWNSPEAVMARALQMANRKLASLVNENARLTEDVAVKTQQIAEMKPKASYYDVCLACKDLLSITEIAKDYGWSGRKMNEWLHDKGIIFRQGKIWLLYQKYAELGYTSTKTHVYTGNDGEPHTKVHTYWTQKGRLFIYQTMKEDGNLPIMERAA